MLILMKRKKLAKLASLLLVLSGCQSTDFDISKVIEDAAGIINDTNEYSSEFKGKSPKNSDDFNLITDINFLPFTASNARRNVYLAVNKNPGFRAKVESIAKANSDVDIMRSVKGMQSYGSLLGGVNAEDQDTEGAIIGQLSISKLLYDSGSTDAKISGSIHQLEAAKIEALIEAEKVALQAFEAWIQLYRTNAINEIFVSGLSKAEPLLGQIENISTAGVSDKAQLLEAKKRFALLKVQANQAEAALEGQRVIFGKLFPKAESESVEKLVALDVGSDSSDAIKASYLLAGQKLTKNAIEMRIASLRADEKPIVSLTAQGRIPAKNTKQDSTLQAGVSVNYTFNDGGARLAKIDAYLSEIETLEQTVGQIELDLIANINGLRERHRSEMERLVALRGLIDLSQELKDTAKAQLITGRSSVKDLLDAEVTLAEVNLEYIDAETNVALASYQLKALTSGILSYIGWSLP